VERGESPNEVGAFEEVGVGRHRLVIEAEAAAEHRGVPGLPMKGRQHAHQSKRLLRLRRQTPLRQIPLREQCQVVLLPLGEHRGAHHTSVGIASAGPEPLELNWFVEFAPKEWRQVQEPEATGERLRHFLYQRRRDRAEQKEASVTFALGIDGRTEPREQLGNVLSFIEHDERSSCHELSPPDFESEPIRVELEIEVAPSPLRAERLCQRRLPCLAGAEQRDGGTLLEELLNPAGQ
jgi:hypothetical protein